MVSFKSRSRTHSALLIAAFVGISGCSTSSTVENGYDPAMKTNRVIHSFNKGVDTAILRPLSKGYDLVVPATVKHIINNEVRFLSLPGTFTNALLQGNLERAGDTAARMVVNATIGGLGALDPATEMRIPEHDEDFGQTLAVWGAESGPYYELPLLGPGSARSIVGMAGDYVLNPLSYFSGNAVTYIGAGSRVASIVDTRFRFGSLIDQALYESPDSYVTVRDLYLQRRKNAILNGDIRGDALPDIYENDTF